MAVARPRSGIDQAAARGEQGPHDVLAQSLQPRAIAAIDHLLGVYVDATHLGHRLIEFGRASDAVWSVLGEDQAERVLAGVIGRVK